MSVCIPASLTLLVTATASHAQPPAPLPRDVEAAWVDAGTDWLVVTPDGRFDGSKDAGRFVAYREPETLRLLDDDATLKRFHRPGLLAEVWKGEK